ncbi:MAG: hypothetical protein GY943_21115 [Chloroflexi bacterium]|nr:hypothetical protein [Chloroflexota bacterium]
MQKAWGRAIYLYAMRLVSPSFTGQRQDRRDSEEQTLSVLTNIPPRQPALQIVFS